MAADGAQGPFVGADELDTVQPDRTVDRRSTGEQTGQAHRSDALAAAGLADDRQYFAVGDLEAHLVDGGQRTVLGPEGHRQVLHL